MVGGAQKDFDEAKLVLDAMAASVVRVGEIGAGNIAKLANQIVVAINIAALAEAMTLSAKAGVMIRESLAANANAIRTGFLWYLPVVACIFLVIFVNPFTGWFMQVTADGRRTYYAPYASTRRVHPQ